MDDVIPVHKMDDTNTGTMNTQSPDLSTQKLIGIFVGLILLGTITGFGISKIQSAMRSKSLTSNTASDAKKNPPKETAGIQDKETFKDSATGILKEGGFEGEGSHRLERPGGKSQNVYITSSTVDLSEYEGQKVTVWGQTFAAEKAGWLMDVGLVEVLN